MKKLKLKKRSRKRLASWRGGLREPSRFVTGAESDQATSGDIQNRLSVCFTGHRYIATADIPVVCKRLDTLLELCYERGYRCFLCGGALGFDMLAGERVSALQSRHPDARLIMVIPCSDQAQRWPGFAVERYERLLYAADEIRVLAPKYYDGCMQVRNRYLVDRSAICICYFRHQKGGTASTVAYALERQLPVLNVAMDNVCAAFS